MDQHQVLCFSSLQHHRTHSCKDYKRCSFWDHNYSRMEHPVLVSQCNEYHKTKGHDPQKGYLAASKIPTNTSTGGQPIADCSAGLHSILECCNLPQLRQNIILSSWRNSTLSKYSSTWVRWQKFCMDKGISNTHTITKHVLEFFYKFIYKWMKL